VEAAENPCVADESVAEADLESACLVGTENHCSRSGLLDPATDTKSDSGSSPVVGTEHLAAEIETSMVTMVQTRSDGLGDGC